MIDNLLKLRPLALLLVVIGFGVEIVITLITTVALGVGGSGFLNAMSLTDASLLAPLFPVVLAALLVLCAVLKPEVPQLRTLALTSLVLTGVSLALGALFSLIGIFGGGPIGFSLLGFVSTLATAVLGVVAFLVILRVFAAQPRPVPSQSAYGQQPGQLGQPGPMGQPGQPGAPLGAGQWNSPGGQPQNAPVWQPDQASGASWGTAQDAAAGNAGTWGGQGQSGWQPQQPNPQPSQQPWSGAQQVPQPGSHPQSQASAGWPQTQPPQHPQPEQQQAYPSGPPQSQPSMGWSPEQQQAYASGQPQSQPQSQASAGYPQSQPSSSQPEPQASTWEDDLDDRTRLTPRVEPEPQDPQPWGQQPGQQPGHPEQGRDERPW